jgi:hypothetical protein
MRHTGGTSFMLPPGNRVFVTNKSNVLSGPELWLAPVGLASLAKAMRDANNDGSNRLFISTDPPDKFDARYPNHVRDVHLERCPDHDRIAVVFPVERDADEDDAAVVRELSQLLDPFIARHRCSGLEVIGDLDFYGDFVVRFRVPTYGKTIADALSIADEAQALVAAASGGRLTLQTTVDLVRAGHGAALIGQPEGPWFEGKKEPYFLPAEDKRWELAKDVAAFANSHDGGVIFIGAQTKKVRDGDVVQSLTDFDLTLIEPPRYHSNLRAKVHPAIEGLEIRTVPTDRGRGMAYIYIPSQRTELKPFVVKGALVSGAVRATHVCIPVRDGEHTRFADPSEVHSLLQAGRVALQRS